jgi:NhaP-type Na+/H+ or K+/H+ antiporter
MIVLLGVAGVLALFAAVLPRVLGDRPLSMPLVLLVVGIVLGVLPLPDEYVLDPTDHLTAVKDFTEIGLVVALAGAGRKADRVIGPRSWSSTWRLLGITMPLSIGVTAVAGSWVLGLAPAAALLLGAALAPTDPVLAGDVQVPEPHADQHQGRDNEIRFTLTTEAGLNDALAMPFVAAALAIAMPEHSSWLGWGLVEVVVPLALGLVIGWVCGKLLAWLMFRVDHERVRLGEYSDGMVMLAIAFLPFAISELVGGLGFLAVFVAALVVRSAERTHEYHSVLHEFGDQMEGLFVAIALLGLGVALPDGLLSGLRWEEVALAVAVLLVVRPVLGWLGLVGSPTTRPAMAAVAFFGVRGVGTLFYLAYAFTHAPVPDSDALWRIGALTVALSVVIHGVTAGPVMNRLERQGAHERQ